MFTGPDRKSEDQNLSLQIRKAVNTISLDFSEGAMSKSDPELKRMLYDHLLNQSSVCTKLHKEIIILMDNSGNNMILHSI
jgi:hypothetical protein